MSESRQKAREIDYQKVKEDQNKWKAKSRLKVLNSEANTSILKFFKRKKKQDAGASDRLRSFREATMCGPDFICISCHGRMFKVAVQKFTEDLIQEIDEKIPISDCIADLQLFTNIEIETSSSRAPDSYTKKKENW